MVGEQLNETVSDARFVVAPAANDNVAYTVNGLNQYDTVGGAALTYDTNGNLTTDDGAQSYVFDAENRLTGVPAQNAVYTYDVLDRRAAKAVGTATTKQVWDGFTAIADYDGAGVLLRRYIEGPGGLLAATAASEAIVFFVHRGPSGSVTALSHGDAAPAADVGKLARHFAYTPFGRTTDDPNAFAFRFAGQQLDAESGLAYMRARYYHAGLGRFLSPDPAGASDGRRRHDQRRPAAITSRAAAITSRAAARC